MDKGGGGFNAFPQNVDKKVFFLSLNPSLKCIQKYQFLATWETPEGQNLYTISKTNT